MKIGILNAFPPDQTKIQWKTNAADVYIDFLNLVPNSFSYASYTVAEGKFPEKVAECEAYLITGSPRGAYDSDPWIGALSTFIQDTINAGTKMVGICFGHQILSEVLGGRVEKSDKGWGLGVQGFEIFSQQPWMTGQSTKCALNFAHQDQVIELPPKAQLLGGNNFCPYALFTIANQVLGLQGHPEFTPEIMEQIFPTLENEVAPEVLAAARNSVKKYPPDNHIMAQWINNFLGKHE
jgi:GMP synthase-like glutamine amidotransferase